MEDGIGSEYLWMMEDLGLGLPGVEHVGDLIPFQKYVLRVAAEKRAEKMNEQMGDQPGGEGYPRSSSEMNDRYQPGGGGRRVVTKHYRNLSAETGADPGEIIRRYKDKKGRE